MHVMVHARFVSQRVCVFCWRWCGVNMRCHVCEHSSRWHIVARHTFLACILLSNAGTHLAGTHTNFGRKSAARCVFRTGIGRRVASCLLSMWSHCVKTCLELPRAYNIENRSCCPSSSSWTNTGPTGDLFSHSPFFRVRIRAVVCRLCVASPSGHTNRLLRYNTYTIITMQRRGLRTTS